MGVFFSRRSEQKTIVVAPAAATVEVKDAATTEVKGDTGTVEHVVTEVQGNTGTVEHTIGEVKGDTGTVEHTVVEVKGDTGTVEPTKPVEDQPDVIVSAKRHKKNHNK